MEYNEYTQNKYIQHVTISSQTYTQSDINSFNARHTLFSLYMFEKRFI